MLNNLPTFYKFFSWSYRSLKNIQNIFNEGELFVITCSGLITLVATSFVYYFFGEYGVNRPQLLYFLTVGLEHLGAVSINSYGHIKIIGLVFSYFSLNVIYWVGLVSFLLSFRKKKIAFIISGFIISLILTLYSLSTGFSHGDFVGAGFPVAFWRGTWSMGYSYFFDPIGFGLDLIFYFGLITTIIVFYYFLRLRHFLFSAKLKSLKILLALSFLVAVTGGFIADYSILFADSYRINKANSIFEHAVQEKDMFVCDVFKKSNSLESDRNYNYCLYKAIVATENEALCSKLIQGQGGCLREIALAKRDPNICRQLDHTSQIATWCLADIAAVIDNIELCAETEDPRYCYYIFFNGSRQRDACNRISDEVQRKICFTR